MSTKNIRKYGDKIRMTLDMSPDFYKRLNDLTTLVEGKSQAHVIREALRLYEYIAQNHEQGSTFFARSANGQEKEIVFFITR
jgi:hypothetical protein